MSSNCDCYPVRYRHVLIGTSCPALTRRFIAIEPREVADSCVAEGFGRDLAVAVRRWLETVPMPLLRAMPFQGQLYVMTPALARRPTQADIVLIFRSSGPPTRFIELPNGQTAELFAAFSYALMDLSEEGEEMWEVPALEHPNLALFWRLGREELLDLLARYASYLCKDFSSY